jgi:predicted house-cleaning noncanonical NTP pyrophosphatase (MazG superfamily)
MTKQHLYSLLLILTLGALGSPNLCAGAVPAVVEEKVAFWGTSTGGMAAAASTLALSLAVSYLPDFVGPATLGLAAIAGFGVRYVPTIIAHKGLRRALQDINTIAEKDGFKEVMKQGAKHAAAGVGEGIRENLADPMGQAIKENIRPMGFTVLGVGAGLIALWYGAKFLNTAFENYVNKPRLDVVVKKTSQNSMLGTLSRQIVVDEPTRDRLNLFLYTNLKVKQSIMSGNEESRFRTALLWGPSGCGKRMFAQEMAHFARMDYYEIPWSSFQKFKEGEATRAIEEFFKYEVTKSPDGAVIYIDNAHMLFSPTLAVGAMPSQYTMIRNALIENLEARSSKFLVIFGMTTKPVLAQDTALIIDDVIEISLPKIAERKRLLKEYRDLYFKKVDAKFQEAVQRMLDDQALENLAKRLDRASASELASFMNTLKIEASLPTSEGLTPALIAQLINRCEQRFGEAIA